MCVCIYKFSYKNCIYYFVNYTVTDLYVYVYTYINCLVNYFTSMF